MSGSPRMTWAVRKNCTASRRRPACVGESIEGSNPQSRKSLRPRSRFGPGWCKPLRRNRLRKEMISPLPIPEGAQQAVEGPQPMVRAEGTAGLIDEGKRVGIPVIADGRVGKIVLEDVGAEIGGGERRSSARVVGHFLESRQGQVGVGQGGRPQADLRALVEVHVAASQQ